MTGFCNLFFPQTTVLTEFWNLACRWPSIRFTVYHRAKRDTTKFQRNCILSQGFARVAYKSCFAVVLICFTLFYFIVHVPALLLSQRSVYWSEEYAKVAKIAKRKSKFNLCDLMLCNKC